MKGGDSAAVLSFRSYFSKYNIISKIRGSENYFILNSLTGNADILEEKKYQEIKLHNFTNHDEYIDKGYLTTKEEEQSLYRHSYIDFLEKRDNSETQIFFVLNYPSMPPAATQQ